MRNYFSLLQQAIDTGFSIAPQIKIALQEGFPTTTTKCLSKEDIVQHTLDLLQGECSQYIDFNTQLLESTMLGWLAVPARIPKVLTIQGRLFRDGDEVPIEWAWLYENNTVHLEVRQRDADILNELPYAIAINAMLVHLVAHQMYAKVGFLGWSASYVYLKDNDLITAKGQLKRKPSAPPLVVMTDHPRDLKSYQPHHIEWINYHSCEE